MLLAIIHEKTCHALSPIQIFAFKLAQSFLILLLALFSHSTYADTVWLNNGGYIVEYDSRPADNREESDTLALFTIGYSWQ